MTGLNKAQLGEGPSRVAGEDVDMTDAPTAEGEIRGMTPLHFGSVTPDLMTGAEGSNPTGAPGAQAAPAGENQPLGTNVSQSREFLITPHRWDRGLTERGQGPVTSDTAMRAGGSSRFGPRSGELSAHATQHRKTVTFQQPASIAGTAAGPSAGTGKRIAKQTQPAVHARTNAQQPAAALHGPTQLARQPLSVHQRSDSATVQRTAMHATDATVAAAAAAAAAATIAAETPQATAEPAQLQAGSSSGAHQPSLDEIIASHVAKALAAAGAESAAAQASRLAKGKQPLMRMDSTPTASPNYSPSASSTKSDGPDAAGEGGMEVEGQTGEQQAAGQTATEQPVAEPARRRNVPSKQMIERVRSIVEEARTRCYAVPTSVDEAQVLQLAHLRMVFTKLTAQHREVVAFLGEGPDTAHMLYDLTEAKELVTDLMAGMVEAQQLAGTLGRAASVTGTAIAHRRPTKLPDKKFEGGAHQTWTEYMRAELNTYYALHKVAAPDRGILAYMSLGTGPRAYVDSLKDAPVNPSEHQAWLDAWLGGPDGLDALTAVLQTNPAYDATAGERGQLHLLTALRIRQDATDLPAKYKQFTMLAADLQRAACLTAKQRMGFLLDMVSPCPALYDRIRRTRDHREWWDGVAPEMLLARAATLESELLAQHKDIVQAREERSSLNRATAATGAADGERKRSPQHKRKREDRKQPQQKEKVDTAEPPGAGTGPSSRRPKKAKTDKPTRPGQLPPAVVQYRREHKMCFRCGSTQHTVSGCSEPEGTATNVARDVKAAAAAASKPGTESQKPPKGGKGKGAGKGQGGKN